MWKNKNKSISSSSTVAGYTIVEVMIFLAITSILAVGALVGLSEQQRNTQFTQASREVESKLNDVMNDFTTGFSPTSSTTCSGGAAAPQGSNYGCTFIGKVVQFSPDGVSGDNARRIRVYSVAGNQFKTVGSLDPVEDIVAAQPYVLTGNTQELPTDFALEVKKMVIRRGAAEEPIGAVGFFSSFARSTSSPTQGVDVSSGRQVTTVIPIPSSALGQSEADLIGLIQSLAAYPGGFTALNASYIGQPVRICLVGTNNKRALIDIADNRSRAATKLTIENIVGGVECP